MKWLETMFKDGVDGSMSSRRVITFLAFIICSVSYLFDQFTFHSAKPELFDSMVYLVIAGLGFTVTEKFVPRKKRDKELHGE